MMRYTDWARNFKIDNILWKRKYIVCFELWRSLQKRQIGSIFTSGVHYIKKLKYDSNT